MARGQKIERFYRAVDRLAEGVGGRRRLGDCTGYQDWPDEGLYFLFSSEETRMWSDQPRLVGVVAAPGPGGRGTLWDELRSHRGSKSGRYAGGGNHRDSPLRREVGKAIVEREGLHEDYPDWGSWASESRPIREAEHDLETAVSDYLRDLTVVALDVPEGGELLPATGISKGGARAENDVESCRRAWLAKNAVALISNYAASGIDPRGDWLGAHSPDDAVAESGFWAWEHVDAAPDHGFLDAFEACIDAAVGHDLMEEPDEIVDAEDHAAAEASASAAVRSD